MTAKQIKLSHKQQVAWNYLEDNITTETLYGGGAGGGKSYLGCIWHIYRRTKYPGSRGLIGRAKLSVLEQSTLVTFFKVATQLGYVQNIHYKYNSQKHIITWVNGSETILKDLFYYPSDPDFTSLGSTEYTDAFIDEASEVKLRAIELVSTRIRWKMEEFNLSPSMLMTTNPTDVDIKERFIEKDGEPVVLKDYQKFVQSLVTENPDENFKKRYIQQLERLSSTYDKDRLLHGDWNAKQEVKNPFSTAFDRRIHVSDIPEYDPKKQLIIHLDFNLTPFSCSFSHMWTDDFGEHDHQFDEVGIAQGSIPKMIDYIKERYKVSLPNCVITGDAMGNRGDISQRDNATLYQQLMVGLNLRESQIKVSFNPTHENSRADCNYYFHHHPDIKIHSRCTGTIRDFENVQVDAFGKIIKGKRTDLNQRADFIDNWRYKVHNLCSDWIERHQRQNK